MPNWEHIILRSFHVIAILSPFVFIICCGIICYSKYLKRKYEKNQKMSKKWNKKYARSADSASDSSTELLCIEVENPNHHVYRTDDNRSLMNPSFRDSVEGSFINVPPEKKRLRYSDSMLQRYNEVDTVEDTSENEIDSCEEPMDPQDENNDSQEELTSPMPKKSMRKVQSKNRNTRTKIVYSDDSKRKQYKCDKGDASLYTVHKDEIKEGHSIGNRNSEEEVEVIFQNSNIPIAKRVLEDDQFYDLRQKFCGSENPFIHTSNPVKDEQSFNRWNTKDTQVYQPDVKSYSIRGQKFFEAENTKYPKVRYAAHFTEEETGNEKPTSNVSSTCDISGKETAVCNFWKSLKTKTVSEKRNKGVQVEIPSAIPNDDGLDLEMNEDETKGFSKPKSQYAIQNKQAQGTLAKANHNQGTQIHENQKLYMPLESEIMEHYPKVQLSLEQVPDYMRNAENRTCRNCKSFPLPRIDTTKPKSIYSRPRGIQTNSHYPCHLDCTQLAENTENIRYCDNCNLRPSFTSKWKNMYGRCNADCDLGNKHNCVCNPTMPMNYYEKNQYSNPYNDTRECQVQRVYLEQENMPLSNHFVQHDNCEHRTSAMKQNIYYNSEHMQQQIGDSELPNLCEYPNKMRVTTHQCIQNKSYTNDHNNPTEPWSVENAVSQENKLYDRNRDTQKEDNSLQLLSYRTRNSKQKMHNAAETAVRTSEIVLVSPNHAKEQHCKQTPKEISKKSKSPIKIDSEESNARQIRAKENVLKRIKRMYPHMDQNVHENNENVVTQMTKFLKSKGIWHLDKKAVGE